MQSSLGWVDSDAFVLIAAMNRLGIVSSLHYAELGYVVRPSV